MRRWHLALPLIGLISLMVWQTGQAQIRSHEIGRLWDSFFPTEALPEYAPVQNQMTYPAGDFSSQRNKNLEGRGLWIGVANFTDKNGRFWGKYVSENGILNYDSPIYTTKIRNRKFFRSRRPRVLVNGASELRVLDPRSGSGILRNAACFPTNRSKPSGPWTSAYR
ncbi:MAG: hypothetical protein Q9P14_06790 [candidate division KSB1 bacterium]|nr:hypothetical protein [candidate division KSB1 bacterium]